MLFQRRLAVAWAFALSSFSAHAFTPSRSFRAAKGRLATNGVRLCSSLVENDITQGFAELSEEAPFSLQDRVLEVFQLVDVDGSGKICEEELGMLLEKLGLAATADEVSALFLDLDSDGNGSVDYHEFLSWYLDVSTAVTDRSSEVMAVLKGRRCVSAFEPTPVPAAVVDDAIAAATRAPDLGGSAPWQFRLLGPETRAQVAAALLLAPKPNQGAASLNWPPTAPGCLVVTCAGLPPDGDGGAPSSAKGRAATADDLMTCACATNHFLLALHVEGLATHWVPPSAVRRGSPQRLAIDAAVGLNAAEERLVALVWFGFAAGGAQPVQTQGAAKPLGAIRTFLP